MMSVVWTSQRQLLSLHDSVRHFIDLDLCSGNKTADHRGRAVCYEILGSWVPFSPKTWISVRFHLFVQSCICSGTDTGLITHPRRPTDSLKDLQILINSDWQQVSGTNTDERKRKIVRTNRRHQNWHGERMEYTLRIVVSERDSHIAYCLPQTLWRHIISSLDGLRKKRPLGVRLPRGQDSVSGLHTQLL